VLIAADLRLAAEWADSEVKADRISSRVESIAKAVSDGWSVYEKEQRHQRFLEDFGSEELWADHAKAQKATPFPLSGYRDAALVNFAKALEAYMLDLTTLSGKTVGELLKLTGHRGTGIPAELLPIVVDLGGAPSSND
jgi:hypothetical protein